MQRVLTTTELALLFAGINAPRFATLRSYVSSSGEVAHHRLNVGVSSDAAKKADVLDYEAALATGVFVDRPEHLAACQRLFERAKANLNPETRSKQAEAASTSRTHLGKAVYYNEASGELFVEGYTMGKQVLVAGEYKQVKSKPETIAQNEVKKELGIRMDSWRCWKIASISGARVQGEELIVDVAPALVAA